MNNYKLLYRYQQRPPFYTLLFLSLQYLFITVSWQFITISIISATNASQLTKESILSTTLLICGIITFLQARSIGWLGGNQLLPPSSNPAYTGASLLAVHTGGLPLLYGMTLFSGVLEMLASPCIRLVKYILPNKYIGLIVMLIGFEVSGLGLVRLLAYKNSPHYLGNLTLGCATVFLTLFI
ncbi:MAG: hypothetical protein GY821_16440 [Gammaproteobacteria bacterium]|nr:hypothetical protein [Gammaproteobacteria bacterium]